MTPKRMNQLLKLVLVLLVVATFGALYFANHRLSTTAQKTAELKATVEADDNQLDVYQRTKAQVDELSYVNDLADTVLPPDEDQSAVVAELSEFAKRAGLSVEQINFVTTGPQSSSAAQQTKTNSTSSTSTVPKGVKVVPIVIDFGEGSEYPSLLQFLRTLESNRRKSQVTNIALTPDPENQAVFKKVSISLNLYTRQPEGAKQ